MSKRANTRYAKEKKRLKNNLRKALAHLRKVKSPPVHKKDVVRDGVVVFEAGSLRTNMGATLTRFSLLRKIAIILKKMEVLKTTDPGHILDVAYAKALAAHSVFLHKVMLDTVHATALIADEVWVAANDAEFAAAA